MNLWTTSANGPVMPHPVIHAKTGPCRRPKVIGPSEALDLETESAARDSASSWPVTSSSIATWRTIMWRAWATARVQHLQQGDMRDDVMPGSA